MRVVFRQAYAVPAPVLQRLLERPASSSRVYLWIQRPLSCLRRRLREPVGDVRGILGRLSVSTLSLQCCQRTSIESQLVGLELFWAYTLPFRGRLLLSSSVLACLFCYRFPIYHDKRDFLAERSTLCNGHSVTGGRGDAGWIVGEGLASSPLVSAVFWIIMQVGSLN